MADMYVGYNGNWTKAEAVWVGQNGNWVKRQDLWVGNNGDWIKVPFAIYLEDIGQEETITSVSTSGAGGYSRGDEAYGGIVIGSLNNGAYLLIASKYHEGDSANVGGGTMNWDANVSGGGSTAISLTDGAYNTYQMIALGNYSTSGSIFGWLQTYVQGLNDYHDWYIPSHDELRDVVHPASEDGIIGSAQAGYWCSTEHDYDHAWSLLWDYGFTNTNPKTTSDYARAVRRQPLS